MDELKEYLRRNAIPYRGGRMLGKVSVSDAAKAAGMSVAAARLAVQVLEHQEFLASFRFDKSPVEVVRYMVAA